MKSEFMYSIDIFHFNIKNFYNSTIITFINKENN